MATKKKAHQNQPLAVALDTLLHAGFRRTAGRTMLLEFLICERGPFTIEEMRRSLRKLNLDLVTVYRCMRAFEKVGLVVRCEFGDGISRYEYQGAEGHHHHVICINCRKTENIEGCGLLVLEEKVRQLGYSGVKHSLEFFGLCKVCELKTQ